MRTMPQNKNSTPVKRYQQALDEHVTERDEEGTLNKEELDATRDAIAERIGYSGLFRQLEFHS